MDESCTQVKGGDFSDTEVFSHLRAPLGHQNAFAPLAKNRADPCLNDWGWGRDMSCNMQEPRYVHIRMSL